MPSWNYFPCTAAVIVSTGLVTFIPEFLECQSWGQGGSLGPQYSDVSCSVAKVAGMNLPILSLKIIYQGKQKEGQKCSRLLAMPVFYQKCCVRLKMQQIFGWGRSPRPPGWLGRGYSLPIVYPTQRLWRLFLGAYSACLAHC